MTSRVVGYRPQRFRDAEFRHFMLQDLDAGQIAAFVERLATRTNLENWDGATPIPELKLAIGFMGEASWQAGHGRVGFE